MKRRILLTVSMVMFFGQTFYPIIAEDAAEYPDQTIGDSESTNKEQETFDDNEIEFTEYEDEQSENVEIDNGISNDELFAGFVDQVFGIASENSGSFSRPGQPDVFSINAYRKGNAGYRRGDKLQGLEKAIYENLVEKIQTIASGSQTITNTDFTIPSAELDYSFEFTAEQLGVENIIVDGGLNPDAKTALANKVSYDGKKIIDALLFDLPYELFWFDKISRTYTGRSGYSISYNSTRVKAVNLSYSIKMPVAKEYSASNELETYDLGDVVGEVYKAADKAGSIVDKYVYDSDYDKLDSYRQEICDLTEYNNEAAHDQSVPYGNPWQLIWVFDDKPETTVVCEGYSKAFKYLCDLTEFNDSEIHCEIVDGVMIASSTGNHMWNIVTMEDGHNYLADITNCDSGTIGGAAYNAPGIGLFLRGTENKSVTDSKTTYEFAVGSSNIKYCYSNNTEDNYSSEELNIYEKDYVPSHYEDALGISADAADSKLIPAIIYKEEDGVIVAKVSANDISENYSNIAYPTINHTFIDSKNNEQGYIFAGWYKDVNGKTYYDEIPSGDAYAKFVNEDLIRLKWQVPAAATLENETMDVRLIAAVDGTNYENLGITLKLNGKEYAVETTTVCERILAKENGQIRVVIPEEAADYAKYIFTVRAKGIKKAYYGNDIVIRGYWTTYDGTKVMGPERTIQIKNHTQFQPNGF